MAEWDFFLYEALSVPFEVTALTMTLSFWRDDISAGGVAAACIVSYSCLRVFAVKIYGEVEFWGSGGKVLLIPILFPFTCDLGRFVGFLESLWMASFTTVEPEYVTLISAETKRPRTYMKKVFQTVFWRFLLFFIMAAISVGILVSYDDPALVANFITTPPMAANPAPPLHNRHADSANLGTAACYERVTRHDHLLCGEHIHVLRQPKPLCFVIRGPRTPDLSKCTGQGVPIYCALPGLTWLTNITTAGGLINYFTMAITFVFFYHACKARGVDRTTFPYYGRFQPYAAWIGVVGEGLIILFFGYGSFRLWDVVKHTTTVGPLAADLVWERPFVDSYERSTLEEPRGFWREMGELVRWFRQKTDGRGQES
ncbi:hypothetical protein BDV11DRAFT_212344 [Aspergillus similis]